MNEKSNSGYAGLVAQAEDAVKTVSDPELKKIAFERVLSDLLTGQKRGTFKSNRSQEAKLTNGMKHAKKSRGGPAAYLAELIADGFFNNQRTISDVKAQLANQGHHIAITSLSGPLQKLCQRKELRRQKAKGKSGAFVYSNY